MRYLIVGGSGSLGAELIKQLSNPEMDYDGAHERVEIYVMSREELKQKQLKAKFPGVKCFLGDAKNASDYEMVVSYVKPDVIFHLAAIKHVEIAEENPEECIAVNLIGTMNGAQAAIRNRVKYFVFSSTDKAVLPINIYGATKFASEKYLFELNRRGSPTIFSVFRWANVIASRGSVIHSFKKSLLDEKTVYLTSHEMTRFWVNIEDVAKFMRDNFMAAKTGHAMIPPMKAASVIRLADMTADVLGIEDYRIEEIGIRAGEKYHECIWSEHTECIRSDISEQYSDDELRALVERAFLHDGCGRGE